jgi:hypothetical protein
MAGFECAAHRQRSPLAHTAGTLSLALGCRWPTRSLLAHAAGAANPPEGRSRAGKGLEEAELAAAWNTAGAAHMAAHRFERAAHRLHRHTPDLDSIAQPGGKGLKVAELAATWNQSRC